jgi:hypothetical protein
VFRHKAQRPDLRIGADLDANLDDAAETNGDVVPKPDAHGLHKASLDGVAGQMDIASNGIWRRSSMNG